MSTSTNIPRNVEVFWGGEWIAPLSVIGWPAKKSEKGLSVRVIDRRGRTVTTSLTWRAKTAPAGARKEET